MTSESETLRLTTSRPALGSNEPQTWAVAVLDDGTEIRMRSLGDRVEIRTWDKTESCNPPALHVKRIGQHVIDVRVGADTAQKVTECDLCSCPGNRCHRRD